MPSDFQKKEVPFSQIKKPLTPSEKDGTVAKSVGMRPRRRRQVGKSYIANRNKDPRSVFYVWPLRASH